MKIPKLFTFLMMLTSIPPQSPQVDAQFQETLKVASIAIPVMVKYFEEIQNTGVDYSYDKKTSSVEVILNANEKKDFNNLAGYALGNKDKGSNKHELCSIYSKYFSDVCAEWNSNPNFIVQECNGNCCYGSGYEEAEGLCYPKCTPGYYSGGGSICYRQDCEKDDNFLYRLTCKLRNRLDGIHDGYYDRGQGKTPNKYMYLDKCKNTSLSTKEENKIQKFYIGENEVEKWTKIVFRSNDDKCDEITKYLASALFYKDEIPFAQIIDGLSIFSNKSGCVVERESKINDKFAIDYPITKIGGSDDSDDVTITDGYCFMFASTELVHNFYRNKDEL